MARLIISREALERGIFKNRQVSVGFNLLLRELLEMSTLPMDELTGYAEEADEIMKSLAGRQWAKGTVRLHLAKCLIGIATGRLG